jgi:hypothetical protein
MLVSSRGTRFKGVELSDAIDCGNFSQRFQHTVELSPKLDELRTPEHPFRFEH